MAIIGTPIVAYSTQTVLTAASVAPAYSAAETYAVGDLVTYKGSLYMCNAEISVAEPWNAGHWTAVNLADELSSKVSKEAGRGLSEENFSAALKAKLEGIEAMSAEEAEDGAAMTARTISAAVLKAAIEALGGNAARDTFVYEQNPAASEWTIQHNLNRYPAVAVADSAGNVVYGDIRYEDRNTVVITFNAAFSGKAYLN